MVPPEGPASVGEHALTCVCAVDRQGEHASVDDRSVAVATVVAAVDQARGWGSAEAAVSREQVERHRLLPSSPLTTITVLHVNVSVRITSDT